MQSLPHLGGGGESGIEKSRSGGHFLVGPGFQDSRVLSDRVGELGELANQNGASDLLRLPRLGRPTAARLNPLRPTAAPAWQRCRGLPLEGWPPSLKFGAKSVEGRTPLQGSKLGDKQGSRLSSASTSKKTSTPHHALAIETQTCRGCSQLAAYFCTHHLHGAYNAAT